MLTRDFKLFKDGAWAKMDNDNAGELFLSPSDNNWYFFSHGRDGAKPIEWASVRKGYECSFWLGEDIEGKMCNYEITIETPTTISFSKGDIVHILSMEDLEKYNSRTTLNAGGNFHGFHAKINRVIGSGTNTILYVEIFDKEGYNLASEWGLYAVDCYEYYGAKPPVTFLGTVDLSGSSIGITGRAGNTSAGKFSTGSSYSTTSEVSIGSYNSSIGSSKSSFIPREGNIIRILSKSDAIKFNGKKILSGGGEFFGMNFLITHALLEDGVFHTLTGDIYDGVVLVRKGWLLSITDFYEYHGINPSSVRQEAAKHTGPISGETEFKPFKTLAGRYSTTPSVLPIQMGQKSKLNPTQDFHVRGDSTIKNIKRDTIILLDL
jgi:hypothetical protein